MSEKRLIRFLFILVLALVGSNIYMHLKIDDIAKLSAMSANYSRNAASNASEASDYAYDAYQSAEEAKDYASEAADNASDASYSAFGNYCSSCPY